MYASDNEAGRVSPITNILQLKQVIDLLPQNIMTLIFYVHCSQELYQATEDAYQVLSELETIFPNSAFLKSERALLYYHSKGIVFVLLDLISPFSYANQLPQISRKPRKYSRISWSHLLSVWTVSTITQTSSMSWAHARNSPSSPKLQQPPTNSAPKPAV